MDRSRDHDDPAGRRSGRVVFDDRGNAIWEAPEAGLTTEGVLQLLELDGLQVADEPGRFGVRAATLDSGFDPYSSGPLGKGPARRGNADMRALSAEILRKRANSSR